MEDQKDKWPKKITVDKRIVRILSGSTYSNFPSAIRELITNSYDADAETVRIEVDLDKEMISVTDDGKGMSETDFAFYLRIAGKTRVKENVYTKNGRKIVGQFGVGFLSVLPFCEKYIIETKKKGSSEIVFATITSTEYFGEDLQSLDVDEIPIQGGLRYDEALFHKQFTRIRLVGFTKLTSSFFDGEYKIKNKRNTKSNFDPLELLKWELSEYLPLKYDDNSETSFRLNEMFQDDSRLDFSVFFNNDKLYRNLHASNILEISDYNEIIGEISFKYAVLTDYKPISPIEARYIMLRNHNVGVGDRTALGLGMEGKVYGKLAHLTLEVNILSGLNDLISVSRDKFNFSPDYEMLKDFLRDVMAKWANELDHYKSLEKSISEYHDVTKVTNLSSIKREHVNNDLQQLENSGFKIVKIENDLDNQPRIEHRTKEIIVNTHPESYDKKILVRNIEYRLKVSRWSISERFPAIRETDGVIEINEHYPPFQQKNFDTLLKTHILFYNYLKSNTIQDTLYHTIINDLTTILTNS